MEVYFGDLIESTLMLKSRKYEWQKYLLLWTASFCLPHLLIACSSSLLVYTSDYVQRTDAEITKLLSRLDLSRDGMKSVEQHKNDPAQAAIALLEYYRERTFVRHPRDREYMVEQEIKLDPKDLEIADDAIKHIFIGQRAYPAFHCGDDINWNSRPVKDMEWVWQLNRMYFWDALAKSFRATGDEKYATAWCHQIVDWTKKNPNDEDHQYAWRSIEAGIRGKSWTGLFFQFLQADSFNPAVLVAMLNSCYDHASYLMTQYKTGSNWALMEAEGLAFIAMTFPEFIESEGWRKEAIKRLSSEITKQVYADGHQRELAMGYHIGCIDWFLRTYQMAEMNGLASDFPATYLSTIEKMCAVPMKLCMPDGTNVPFGDAWMGSSGQHADRFKKWSTMFGRSDFLYLATLGEQGSPPRATAFALPESGLYSMRSDWSSDALCLVLKCGPDGGGHCQPDNGTFDLYVGNKNLMPDAGSYIYSGDPEGRKWFRQSSVHQTLTLNGVNTRYAPKLRLWKPGEEHDILVVENQSYPHLKHRRSVIFVDKKYFVVIDEALGRDTGAVDIHFQLAPGEAVYDSDSFRVLSNYSKGWNLSVMTMPESDLKLEEELGQVSYEYTKKQPRPAFRFRQQKTATEHIRFVTIIQPFPESTSPTRYSAVVHSSIGDPNIQMSISEGSQLRKISFGLEER
ncbi:MAG: alginate lyase family protein [Saprospiraceae bacterium]|nr:alginate lyase family protein [Saprospiraceae bacterium]